MSQFISVVGSWFQNVFNTHPFSRLSYHDSMEMSTLHVPMSFQSLATVAQSVSILFSKALIEKVEVPVLLRHRNSSKFTKPSC